MILMKNTAKAIMWSWCIFPRRPSGCPGRQSSSSHPNWKSPPLWISMHPPTCFCGRWHREQCSIACTALLTSRAGRVEFLPRLLRWFAGSRSASAGFACCFCPPESSGCATEWGLRYICLGEYHFIVNLGAEGLFALLGSRGVGVMEFEVVGQFDAGHVGVVEVHLNSNLELSPADLLDFEWMFVYFWIYRLVHLTGFWKEACNLNTTFLMR